MFPHVNLQIHRLGRYINCGTQAMRSRRPPACPLRRFPNTYGLLGVFDRIQALGLELIAAASLADESEPAGLG